MDEHLTNPEGEIVLVEVDLEKLKSSELPLCPNMAKEPPLPLPVWLPFGKGVVRKSFFEVELFEAVEVCCFFNPVNNSDVFLFDLNDFFKFFTKEKMVVNLIQ